jgi:hypothetical protein
MTRWMFPLSPEPGETLSSWLYRCAIANRMAAYPFSRTMFPHNQLWDRDIDRSFRMELSPILETYLGVSRSTVKQMLLTSYAGWFSSTIRDRPHQPWFTKAGEYHRRLKTHGQQYCPMCLHQNPAYFRMRWRLSFVTVCVEHKLILLDCCPGCGIPITPHRLIMSSIVGPRCEACGADISDVKPMSASRAVLALSRALLITRHTKQIVLNQHALSSLCFFRGLRILVAASLSQQSAMGLRSPDVVRQMQRFPMAAQSSFDRQRTPVRHAVLQQVHHWLNDWPHTLRQLMKEKRVKPSRVSSDFPHPPLWIVHGLGHRMNYSQRRRNRVINDRGGHK